MRPTVKEFRPDVPQIVSKPPWRKELITRRGASCRGGVKSWNWESRKQKLQGVDAGGGQGLLLALDALHFADPGVGVQAEALIVGGQAVN